MKATGRLVSMAVVLISVLFMAHVGFAAYNHQGDIDSANFRAVYPDKVGTKLDSCTTCHSGGSYTSGGRTTTLGSCQWCHYVTDYGDDQHRSDLLKTLNSYGSAYQEQDETLPHWGRSAVSILMVTASSIRQKSLP